MCFLLFYIFNNCFYRNNKKETKYSIQEIEEKNEKKDSDLNLHFNYDSDPPTYNSIFKN